MLLGALWGGSLLFIRVAVPALGPFLLVELRVGLAVAALFLYALSPPAACRRSGAGGGVPRPPFLNAALPFSLISAAEIHLTASLAAILNATTVLLRRWLAAVWMGDALYGRKAIGIVLGIVGVSVLVNGTRSLERGRPVRCGGDAACFALLRAGSHLRQAIVSAIPPLGMAIGQVGGATALFLPLAVVSLPERGAFGCRNPLHAQAGFALDRGGLPDLLPTHRERWAPQAHLPLHYSCLSSGCCSASCSSMNLSGLARWPGYGIILTSVVLITGIVLPKSKSEQGYS